MRALIFDTCFDACSAAVVQDGEILAARLAPMERGHAEALMPMIAEVMSQAGLAFGDLHQLGVTRGPGTFTGLRVGVAAARGLALAAALPAVTFSSLEALAWSAWRDGHIPSAARFAIVVDARRGEVYRQCFEAGTPGAPLKVLTQAQVIRHADATAGLPENTSLLAGSAAQSLHALPGGAELDWCGIAPPDAAALAVPACRHATRDKIIPLYLRAPDAKPQPAPSIVRQSPAGPR